MPKLLRGRLLASVSLLVPLISAGPAMAADLSLSNGRTSPVITSNIDNTGPGNLTVQSAGSITVGDPTAVRIDSNNTVDNSGAITTNFEGPGANGVLAHVSRGVPGLAPAIDLTSSINNSGTINVPGPASTSSLVNTDVFNSGIRVETTGTGPGPGTGPATGTFYGGITNSGTITVGGRSSYGIRVDGAMVGDLTNSGTISTPGTNAAGIFTTGPITGSVTHSGSISGTGTGALGIYIGNTVTGSVINNGIISTGNSATVDLSTGLAVTPNSAAAGIWIAGSVNQGVLLGGNSHTKAQEAADTTISTTGESSINTVGSGPGLVIAPGSAGGFQNVLIGQRPDAPYGIVNNGNVIAAANAAGVNALAVDIHGATDGVANYTAALSGGFMNGGGNINASAIDGTATGFHVGAGGIVPALNNTGDILVSTTDSTANVAQGTLGTKGGNAYGVVIDAGGVLNSFTNTGNLTVTTQGPTSAYGVIDRSGTLSTFVNTGKITPTIDKLSPGTIVGVDLSSNTQGVNFTNNGTITGPVLIGSGTNAFTMNGGTQTGNVSFVGGANTLTLANSTVTGNIGLGASNSIVSLTNTTLNGGLSYTTGSMQLTAAQNTHISIPDSQFLKVTNASFNSTSKIVFNINPSKPTGGGTIVATGNVSVANGAALTPEFTEIVTTPQTVRLISAGNLALGAPVANLVTPNTSFINVYTVGLDPTNSNTLLLNVHAKTAAEIGLDANMSALYNGAVGALQRDSGVATALAAQTTRAGVVGALGQLLPDVTDARRQVAIASNDLTLGAVRRRLAGIANDRSQGHDDRSSVWAQAMGTGAHADPSGDELGYSDWSIGVGLGIDTNLGSSTLIGLAVTKVFTTVNLRAEPNSPEFIDATRADIYARQELGPLYLQGMAGGAYDTYRQTHNVTIDSFKRTTTGKGNGYQFGGTLELGTAIGMGNFVLDPYVRAAYLDLHHDAFTETGGGAGIDLVIDPHSETSLRGSVGFNLERDFTLEYDSVLETDVRGSYTREFHNNVSTFASHFASDGTPFANSTLLHGPSFYSAGLAVGHKDSFSAVTLDYDAQMAKGYLGHIATVTLRFRI